MADTDNAALIAENEDLKAKLQRAYSEYTKLRKSYKELEADWHLLMRGKRQKDYKLGMVNERHNQEIERIRAEHKHQDILTAIFAAAGGFMACAVIVWALVQFVWR